MKIALKRVPEGGSFLIYEGNMKYYVVCTYVTTLETYWCYQSIRGIDRLTKFIKDACHYSLNDAKNLVDRINANPVFKNARILGPEEESIQLKWKTITI